MPKLIYDLFLVRAARHNPGVAIAVALGLLLTGCTLFPFKVASPTDAAEFVTRDQLNVEIVAFESSIKSQVETFYAKAAAADAELSKKEAIASLGLTTISNLAKNSGIPLTEALTGLFAFVSAGALYDNSRKNTQLLISKDKDKDKTHKEEV